MGRPKTVFIVGAGASAPFGFPVGAELKRRIWETGPAIQPTDPRIGRISPHAINSLRTALRDSGQSSIDAFLAKRAEFVELGRAMIAAQLLPCQLNALKEGRLSTDWYQWIFHRIQTNDGVHFNNIEFVTFNYDRSLEWGFERMIAESFPHIPGGLAMPPAGLRVHHVYGILGGYTNARDAIRSDFSCNDDIIFHASKTIQIVPEGRDNLPHIQTIRELVWASEHLIFLGFGYDPINLKRIGISPEEPKWMSPHRPIRKVYGTAMGLQGIERNAALDRLGVTVHEFGGEEVGCFEFLRNHVQID